MVHRQEDEYRRRTIGLELNNNAKDKNSIKYPHADVYDEEKRLCKLFENDIGIQ